MATRSACGVALALLTGLALAQSCPPTVQVRSEPQKMEPGWEANPAMSTHNLVGVSIIEGLLGSDGNPRFELAPSQMPNGTQLWKFVRPLNANEVWMRCWFADSQVQLTRPIDARVTECEQRITHDPKTRKILKATGVCR